MRVLPRAVRFYRRPTLPASRTYSTARCLGQPTHETHPHLLKAGEITPGIAAFEYALRRAKLAAALPPGGVAVIPSASVKYRSGPVFYEFHQDPDFFYLTGFLEPESVAVIEKTGGEGQHDFHLFVRAKDEHAELWDGARTGVDGAKAVFNADQTYDVRQLHLHMTPLLERAAAVYADVPKQPLSAYAALFGSAAAYSSLLSPALGGRPTQPLRPTMHQLRATKSGAEAAVMRRVGKMSGRTYTEAMRRGFASEKELWAFLDYSFRSGGCDRSAYVPVVAGGANALSVHYTSNDSLLRDGDLVLVDAGGQYGGYMTDITRTWPVGGKFTPAQRDLYTAVLNVQRRCVGLCRESADMSLNDIHQVSVDGLADELAQLGFSPSRDSLCKILYPHHVGHYIGVDLHDCATYGLVKKLHAGQVVTIEPGVYVPDDECWPKHFRGMGIRIEDTVYVGEQHPIVLSVEAVKEIDDIEALRR